MNGEYQEWESKCLGISTVSEVRIGPPRVDPDQEGSSIQTKAKRGRGGGPRRGQSVSCAIRGCFREARCAVRAVRRRDKADGMRPSASPSGPEACYGGGRGRLSMVVADPPPSLGLSVTACGCS